MTLLQTIETPGGYSNVVSPDNVQAATKALTGSRPYWQEGAPDKMLAVIANSRGLRLNSLLRKDEWEKLDMAVVDAARQRLNGVADLRTRGLVAPLGGLGTMVSQWNQASEMSAASVSMTGQAGRDLDRVDFKLAGVPVPIIFKDYSIPMRQLEASRSLGSAIDTSHAFAASRVVAEGVENMLFNGSTVTLNGAQIYGYTNHPSRNTDTATNYGGGDFSTLSNIQPTILGMIAAANADRFFGAFGLYLANAQYIECLETYSDGSGQNALDRILALPMIDFVSPSDWLTAGEGVLVQMTPDVVDLGIGQELVNVEWVSSDTLTGNFKVMMAVAPRIKADYAGRSGIVHVTGA